MEGACVGICGSGSGLSPGFSAQKCYRRSGECKLATCAGASFSPGHLCFWNPLNLGVLPEAVLHPGFFLFYTVCLESEAGLIVVTCPCCSVAK